MNRICGFAEDLSFELKRNGHRTAGELEPVYAFDREVLGGVSRPDPVSKMKRASAILGGDFTSLHQAEVEITSLSLPGGRRLVLRTMAERSNSIRMRQLTSASDRDPLDQVRSFTKPMEEPRAAANDFK